MKCIYFKYQDICDYVSLLFRNGKGLADVLAFLSCTGLQHNSRPKHSFSHKRPNLGWAQGQLPRWKKVWYIINHYSLENSFFPCFNFPLFLVYFFFLLSTISYFLWVSPSLVNFLAGSWGLGSLTEMWPIFSTGDKRTELFFRWIWNPSLSRVMEIF